MHQTKAQRQQEVAERDQTFHKRVTIGIVCGFALLVLTALFVATVVA